MDECGGGKGLGGEGEFEREAMELKSEGKGRKESSGFKEGGESALVGEDEVAEHGDEVLEGESGVGVSAD